MPEWMQRATHAGTEAEAAMKKRSGVRKGESWVDRGDIGRAHFGLSRIDYPDDNHGLLLYIKSSLTGNESEFLKKYHADHPDFPNQSTAEQLYSETQFEAYRALGEHIARDLFREDLVGNWRNTTPVREWFCRLASRLLDA